LLDINNAENFLSDESSQLKKELKKKGWWSDSEFSLNNNKIEEGTEAGPSEKLKGKEISTEETNSSKNLLSNPLLRMEKFYLIV